MIELLIICFLLVGLLQLGFCPQIEALLIAAGEAGQPFGFLMLAPILELGGGPLLLLSAPDLQGKRPRWLRIRWLNRFLDLFSPPKHSVDPFTWGDEMVKLLIGQGKIKFQSGETTKPQLLTLRRDYLQRKNHLRGFGVLSLGFLFQLLALFWPGTVSAFWAGIGTLCLGMALILVQKLVKPSEEVEARRYSRDSI